MKKKLILLFCLFILTGCSKVEYSLVVTNDNKIQEKIVIPYNNTKKNQKKIDDMMKVKQIAYHSSSTSNDYYYNVNIDKSDKKKLLLTYSYDYDTNNIINSEAINACFYKKDIIKANKKFIVKTENISCLKDEYQQLVDEVTVSIEVPKNYKNIKNKSLKIVLISLLSLLIIMIGISRIYLGVHYTSDVCAGFLVSISYLIIYINCANKLIFAEEKINKIEK